MGVLSKRGGRSLQQTRAKHERSCRLSTNTPQAAGKRASELTRACRGSGGGDETSRRDKIAPIRTESAFTGGSLPLRRPMDDEEEDTSRAASPSWGAPFADLKYGERAARIQSPALALVPRVHDDDGICALACDLQMQHRVPFHGNATWRWHFPARLEPLEDRGTRRAAAAEEDRRREGDDRMAERPDRRRQAAASAEAQIGQKLREIGDKFQRDHLDVFLRQQRQNLPAWMRLTMALFGFLFPRPFAVPARRAELR